MLVTALTPIQAEIPCMIIAVSTFILCCILFRIASTGSLTPSLFCFNGSPSNNLLTNLKKFTCTDIQLIGNLAFDKDI